MQTHVRPGSPAAAVAHLLARQAGVVSRAQALAAGMTAAAIDHRLRTRRWHPVHPRVYLDAAHPLGQEARIRAAVLWAGADAVLCGVAAVWWHGVPVEPPADVTVAVPRLRPLRPRTGVRVRCRHYEPHHVLTRRGLSLTARGISVLDGALELGDRGAAFLDRALQYGVPFAEVDAAFGATGSRAAAHLLDTVRARSATAATDLLARLLLGAGIRGWRPGSAGPGQAVVVFPDVRVALVVDGWAASQDAPALPPGWRLLRYDWRDLGPQTKAILAAVGQAATSCRSRPRTRGFRGCGGPGYRES